MKDLRLISFLHWVPEMVEIAGGEDALDRKGADSEDISLKEHE